MDRVGMILANRYQLTEKIGSGGMADVYKAIDRRLNRYVAVKVLRSEFNTDESFINRFQQEAQAVASLHSPCVVNVYDVGEECGINYIIMEYAEGITLKEYIQKKGKLDIVESIDIATQIATGIREAHTHGIIHRDIKPQNVMISSEGKAKVMDFGIARAVTAQTITANTVGSVHYISPEQARGSSCDERCDIYSMGITMYEMITGKVPFDGESTVAIALAHIKEPITPPSVYDPMIPVSLEKIILKCTQKKVESRYASADELIEDLKKALMTPNEDFVKDNSLVSEGGDTQVFSKEDIKDIKEQADAVPVPAPVPAPVISKEEEDYLLDVDETEEEALDEAKEGKAERMALIVGIGALLVVLLIGGILAAKALNLFEKDSPKEETAAETVADNQLRMPDVVNVPLEEAIKLLKEAELLSYEVEQQADNKIEEGYVIRASVETDAVVNKDEQIILYVSSGKDTVEIPKTIIGLKSDTAISALEALKLEVVVEKGPSDEYSEGLVYDCKPGPEQEVQIHSKVVIYVSNGETISCTVPRLVGETTAVAEYLIKNNDLKGNPSYDYSDSVEKGYVISQSPDAGDKIEKGGQVSYVISLGPKITVPELINLKQDEAEEKLSDAKLGCKVESEYSDSVEAGYVIRQSEEKGTVVEEGTVITIVVSLGKEETTAMIPNVIGHTEEEAIAMFNKAGLRYKNMGTQNSDEYEAGLICYTDIDPGEEVESDTIIGYIVSSGPEEVDGEEDE